MINKLSESNRKKAIIAAEALKEIRFASLPQAEMVEPEGLLMSEMDTESQTRLKQLLDVYVHAVPESIAKDRKAIIDADGAGNIYFAWAGATRPVWGITIAFKASRS